MPPANPGARASRPQKQKRARCPRSRKESASTPPQRRRPLTGVCRRKRSSARHSCRVAVGQRHGPRPVDGPSRWYKSRSANVSPAKQGARASRPQKQKRARCPRSKDESASTPPTNPGARASRPQISERGLLARNDKCGQDARAPKRKRPEGRPRIRERGRPARNSPTHREAPSTGLEVQPVIETVTRRETPGRRPPTADKARQRASVFDIFPVPVFDFPEPFLDRFIPPRREGPSTGLRIGRYRATTKGREIITALCHSQHVTLQQLDAFAA